MSRHHHKPWWRRLRSLHIWHRHIGLFAALFAVLLSVTGILLNHTEDLALDQRYATGSGLLHWYGIDTPSEPRSFRFVDVFVSQMGKRLYLDATPIGDSDSELVGAVRSTGLLVLATRDFVHLYTPEGERVETQPTPVGMLQAVGIDREQRAWLRGDRGTVRADSELIEWIPAQAGADIHWSSHVAPPATLRARLIQTNAHGLLSWERILLDLHSGRIFGRFGVWLMDAAGIALLMLGLSGSWLWWQRRAARRHRQHPN